MNSHELTESLHALNLPTVYDKKAALDAWEELLDAQCAARNGESGALALQGQAEEKWGQMLDAYTWDVYQRGGDDAREASDLRTPLTV